jgi:hypothetical protein
LSEWGFTLINGLGIWDLSNVNILTSSNPTTHNSDSILVQAEVTPIDHPCVDFYGFAKE